MKRVFATLAVMFALTVLAAPTAILACIPPTPDAAPAATGVVSNALDELPGGG